MKKRRKFTSDFKSKVALEALREQQPIHEIAKRYQVHPTQVTEWKKALLSNVVPPLNSRFNKRVFV
jgi:transposase